MRRLEIIHLRSTRSVPEVFVEELLHAVATAGPGGSGRVCRRDAVEGDISVHVHHAAGGGPGEIGIHLAAALRERGMVEPTIWSERTEGDR